MRQDNHLKLVIDRVNRGMYSPAEVFKSLCGRGYDPLVIDYLCKCSEVISSEKAKPIPRFTDHTPTPPRVREKYAKLVIAKDPEYHSDGSAWHSYWGGWNDNRYFVKSFIDGHVELSKNENEAYKFHDDRECDECMAKLIMEHHVWTIAIWDDGSQCVHYPNNNWYNNDFLEPSFINRRGVNEFEKEGVVFDRRRGWHRK